MASTDVRILVLSDVAVGYGSPQVQYLLRSLADVYAGASLMLVEPDQKRRSVREAMYPEIDVVRIVTTFPPYDVRFMIEFNMEARRIINAYRPHIIVGTHGWVLPAILTSAWKPHIFIYYMLESISHQKAGIGPWAEELNRHALSTATLVLVPERRRANADLRALGWQKEDLIEVLNCAPRDPEWAPTPWRDRTPKILYAGSIGPQTLCQFFASESVADVEFDIAGPAENEASRELLRQFAQRRNVRYLGVLGSEELARIRGRYAYSVVMWSPSDVNQLFASPNKFFESIQAGVPPICAPHPQCADILARYGCGRIFMDWSEGAFAWTVRDAIRVFKKKPAEYQALVEACGSASEVELSWENQFRQIAERLPSREALGVLS